MQGLLLPKSAHTRCLGCFFRPEHRHIPVADCFLGDRILTRHFVERFGLFKEAVSSGSAVLSIPSVAGSEVRE